MCRGETEACFIPFFQLVPDECKEPQSTSWSGAHVSVPLAMWGVREALTPPLSEVMP